MGRCKTCGRITRPETRTCGNKNPDECFVCHRCGGECKDKFPDLSNDLELVTQSNSHEYNAYDVGATVRESEPRHFVHVEPKRRSIEPKPKKSKPKKCSVCDVMFENKHNLFIHVVTDRLHAELTRQFEERHRLNREFRDLTQMVG